MKTPTPRCPGRTLPVVALLLLMALPALAQTRISEIRTDKARYNPGSTVNFTLTLNQAQSGLSLEVRNFHLNNIVSPQTVTVPAPAPLSPGRGRPPTPTTGATW
jgi:hypothetical protein